MESNLEGTYNADSFDRIRWDGGEGFLNRAHLLDEAGNSMIRFLMYGEVLAASSIARYKHVSVANYYV